MNARSIPSAAVLLVAALALGACDSTKESLGLGKQSPDEFQVVTRAPLALPPDYNLRPPSPGAARPQEQAPSDSARNALLSSGGATRGGGGAVFGAGAPSGSLTPNSPGESALLARAGTDRAIPDIRGVVNRETSVLAEESEAFTESLVFWRESPEFGTAVDPNAESQRIRENQALGRPVTQGRTPTIERRQQGVLQGLF